MSGNCLDNDPPRSPYEITIETNGVPAKLIETIYIPDEIKGTLAESLFLEKLETFSISKSCVHYFSDLDAHGVNSYDHCLLRYGKFTIEHLLDAIKNKHLIHIFGESY